MNPSEDILLELQFWENNLDHFIPLMWLFCPCLCTNTASTRAQLNSADIKKKEKKKGTVI